MKSVKFKNLKEGQRFSLEEDFSVHPFWYVPMRIFGSLERKHFVAEINNWVINEINPEAEVFVEA